MRNFAFAVVMLVLFVVPTFAQDVRVLPFESLFQNLEAVPNGNGLDVVQAGRPLHVYTVVEVPPGAMRVRFIYSLASDESSSLHLVTTDTARTISIRNTDGEIVQRKVTVRLMYFCKNVEETTCRGTLQSLLDQGVRIQSLGVPNLEGLESLPEKDLILSFRMASNGKLRW